MLAGSSVMPSLVSTSAADGSTSPSSTSCTDTGSLSGSWPRENVRHPCGSRSTSSTRRPFSSIAAPNDATVVVLATPPFWLATASTRVTLPSKHAHRPSHDWWGRIGGVAPQTHRLLLLRHGETEWSRSGKHTSRTELDLTDEGREQAKSAGETLAQLRLDNPYVVSSPRKRALVTAELAGLKVDEVTPLISEWDYGDYEGTTTDEIRKAVPDWLVWTHGCPGGETVAQVGERADRAIAMALEHMQSRDVLFVGHGHFSRAVLTRWIEQPLYEGIRFAMVAATIAACGFEHNVRQISRLGTTGYPRPLYR